jgi:hypothetical protein
MSRKAGHGNKMNKGVHKLNFDKTVHMPKGVLYVVVLKQRQVEEDPGAKVTQGSTNSMGDAQVGIFFNWLKMVEKWQLSACWQQNPSLLTKHTACMGTWDKQKCMGSAIYTDKNLPSKDLNSANIAAKPRQNS